MDEPQGAVMDERHGESPPFGTSRPFPQSGPPQLGEWEIRDAIEEIGMGVIPPTDYPEMEMHQVSEEAQKAFLQSLNPPTNGSLEWASFQDINIAPVSEENAYEILRFLNQSMGSSMKASPP